MKSLKVAALTIALLASGSAFAAQKDITVVAEVDPNLEILQPDGSALPSLVRMNYIVGVGLQPARIQTKIFTNDIAKKINIKLTNDTPKLAAMTSGNPAVPLTVSYNGTPLNAAGVEFTPAQLNLTASTAPVGSSQAMPLEIAQKTPGALAAGAYEGVVSLVLTQAP